MIKKITYILFLFLFLPALALAETVSDQSDATKQTLTTFVEKNNTADAAILIYHDGKFQPYYFGGAKPATAFQVGAVPDILTGLILAQQVDAAKVQLAMPLKNFYPTITDVFGKISLRSLATNTSGLPANVPESFLNNANQENIVDETWQPSIVGMTLLTKVLENTTHKNLAELYQKQIFSVLGMTATKITPNGLKTSAPDMQKFLAAAIGLPGTPESVLYPMRLTQTAFVELQDRMLGLGWQINVHDVSPEEQDNSVKEVPEHPKYSAERLYERGSPNTYIAVLPNKKSGIVILLSKPVDEKMLAQLGRQIVVGAPK